MLRDPSARLAILIIFALTFVNALEGQTQPSTRGARRAPISTSPREQLPFTNGDLKSTDAALPTLFIAGDSTAARNNDADHRGWGAVLVDYFDTAKINLVNQAQGGASFPSYYAARWPAVVEAMKPGDFVVIEFGHNGGHLPGIGEEPRQGPARTGAAGPEVTLHTYGWYVRKFIPDARAKGATPIVSTTTVRNLWTNPNATFRDGSIVDKKEDYQPAGDRGERGMGQVMENGKRSM